MKRLRATVDIYVNMDDDMTEQDAIDEANRFIDNANQTATATGETPELSEIITYEVYDTTTEGDES